MKLSFEIDEETVKELITGLMQNYPEASTPSLQCVPHEDGTWGYDECEYLFADADEDELEPGVKCGTAYSKRAGSCVYVLKYEDLRRGFEAFIRMKIEGKLPGIELDMSYLSRPNEWDDWEGFWDGDSIDAMVQCAIFGDVIYG